MDAYRGLQASLVDAVRNSEVWSKRLEMAWLGALLPGATDGFDSCVEYLAALKSKGLQQLDEGIDDRRMVQLGAMLYRLGRYDEAHRALADMAAKLKLGQHRKLICKMSSTCQIGDG